MLFEQGQVLTSSLSCHIIIFFLNVETNISIFQKDMLISMV